MKLPTKIVSGGLAIIAVLIALSSAGVIPTIPGLPAVQQFLETQQDPATVPTDEATDVGEAASGAEGTATEALDTATDTATDTVKTGVEAVTDEAEAVIEGAETETGVAIEAVGGESTEEKTE